MIKGQLNILYHFRVRGVGAEGVHIAGIVNGFRALGHKVHLISPTNADPTREAPLQKSGQKPSSIKTIILHKLADVLPQPFFELMEILYNFPAIIRLWQAVRSGGVDLIYERYAFFNFAGAFVSKRKKIPLIVEVNELSGHERIRGQSFVRLCSAFEKYVLRRAVLVVTVSDFLNRKASGKINSENTKIVTIPNGVPGDWFEREIPEQEVTILRDKYNMGGKKIICFVGGLVHWHNFDLLLQALKEVQAKVADVVLMFVGDGPLKDYIKESAKVLALPSNSVIFVGKVRHSDIPVYLKMADVAVIPETNDFRSPIKMFEYMAMGKAVVAPQKPAIASVISHNKDGVLFDPGNCSSLAGALSQCLVDTEFSKGLALAAKEKISRKYTWEKHAERILLKSFGHTKRGKGDVEN